MSSDFTEYYELLYENGNLEEVQEVIDKSGAGVFRLEAFVMDVLGGEISLDLEMILDLLGEVAFSGIHNTSSELFRIIGIALIAAVFSNFSFSFRESNVSETAFYVCYVILYGILAVTFYGAYEITIEVIRHVTEFMKIIAPSYCIAIVLGNGIVSSTYWYQTIVIVVAIAENLLLKVVLPLVGVYMTVSLAGNISGENVLSKLCEIIEQIVGWCLKGMVTLLVGFSGVKGMLAPAIDRIKRAGLMKSAESIPGIGNVIGGVNETLLGIGVLLKDAFGTGCMIAIFVIGVIPLIRLAVYSLVYKAEAALIQPVSDKRIVSCLNMAATAAGMLMKTVFTASALFIIVIAVVVYTGL